MDCCWVGRNFTLLLLITVSSTSWPPETTATDPKIYTSVEKFYDSVKQKTPELTSSVKDVYESSLCYGSSAVNWVGDAVRDIANWGLKNGHATRDIGSGIYHSVKQNLRDLNSVKDVYNSVKEKTPDLSSVKEIYKTSYSYGTSAINNMDTAVRETANHYFQDEKTRSYLTKFGESLILAIMLELATNVPGGEPVYNIILKSIHGDKSLKDYLEQTDLAEFVSEFAKNVGFYAIEKGARTVPGGVSAYKILSQLLRSLHENKEMEDLRRELKELRDRIDKLEKEGCDCKKLHDGTEIRETVSGRKLEK